MSRPILVAVAWPYANGPRHIGHVAGFGVPSDTFARYQRMCGNRVLMVSGTDEHGTPITVEAEKQGLTPTEFAERNNAFIVEDLQRLGMSYDLFTRTTTKNHARVVQDLFTQLLANGGIFSQGQVSAFASSDGRALPDRYIEGTCPHCGDTGARGDQCDNCGRQLDPSELINPHSNIDGSEPVFRESVQWFLDLPKFAEPIRTWIQGQESWRPNVKAFSLNLLDGAVARAITRDIDWGVAIPLDEFGPDATKRIYVWFEAVIGYLSASIEWAHLVDDPEEWRAWWENDDARHYYFMGKDNIVFHSFLWPAMLMGYRDNGPLTQGHRAFQLPYDVVSSEFLTMEGAKFSSSRGVVIYVRDVLDRYSTDALRYFLSIAGPENSDSDFTWSEFVRRNNDELVANWGNLVNRTISMTARYFGAMPELTNLQPQDDALLAAIDGGFTTVGEMLGECRFKAAIGEVMRLSSEVNAYLSDEAPWKSAEADPARTATVLATALTCVANINLLMTPFLPHSGGKVCEMLGLGDQAPPLPIIETADPCGDGDPHRILVTPNAQAGLPWQPLRLAAGTPLAKPEPIFTKLDPSVVDDELARLGA
jgi:methionyl-tRNA synthetase